MRFSTSVIFLFVSLTLLGCDRNPETLKSNPNIEMALPNVSTADSCIESDMIEFSGGDLLRVSDRVVVGTVTDVIVKREMTHPIAQCDPETVTWSIDIEMEVDTNIKGSGDTVVFGLGSESSWSWSSRPISKIDGKWRPSTATRTIEVSQELAWTGDTGVQPGQRILAFLVGVPGSYSNVDYPLAEVTDNGVLFQSETVAGSCVKLSSSLINAKTVSDLRSAMQEPQLYPQAPAPHTGFTGETRSHCLLSSSADQIEPESPDPAGAP